MPVLNLGAAQERTNCVPWKKAVFSIPAWVFPLSSSCVLTAGAVWVFSELLLISSFSYLSQIRSTRCIPILALRLLSALFSFKFLTQPFFLTFPAAIK